MYKVSVRNEVDGREFSAEIQSLEEKNAWKQKAIDNNWWGEPERLIRGDKLTPELTNRILSSTTYNEGLADEYVEHLIMCDYVITESEDKSSEWSQLREKRDSILQDTIWMYQRHQQELELGGGTTLSAQDYTNWLNYWQYLRNLPSQYTDLTIDSAQVLDFADWLVS